MSSESPGRNIDWANLDPSVAQYLRSQGFRPSDSADSPMMVANQRGLATIGVLEKPKRKQRGRGETQIEKRFMELCIRANIRRLIIRAWFKPLILRIGPDTTFEPDAMVLDAESQIWAIDTKGPWIDGDSRLKIKIAAEKYSMWRWLIVTCPEGKWRAQEVTAEKGIGRKPIQVSWITDL